MMNPNFVDTITLTAVDDTTTMDSQNIWSSMSQGISITTNPLTVGGFSSNGVMGTNNPYVFSGGPPSSTVDVSQSGKISLRGDNADIEINGVSLAETLQGIQDRLAILRPNEELEEKWENLRGLRKAYLELEAEIKEKEKMWNSLKHKSNNKA
jgi:hypothetical protein